MTLDELLKAFYGVGTAALAILTAGLGVIAYHTPNIIRTWLEKNKLVNLERAGAISARSSEENGRASGWSGDTKAVQAMALVKSIAPHAASKVDARELADVVKAGVQQLRVSVPTPSSAPPPLDILRPPRVPGDIS